MSMSVIKMKLLEFIFCLLRRGVRCAPDSENLSSMKTAVIINNKRLGDFLFSTPSIRAIRMANPEIKIIVVTSKQNAGLIGKNPFIDHVLIMNDTFSDAFRIGRILRSYSPELGISFHSKTPYDCIALTVSKSRCVLKHYFGNEKKVLMKAFDGYVLGGKIPPVLNDLQLIGKVGIRTACADMFYPAMLPEKKTEKLIVGIQLGASSSKRFFPTSNAAEMVLKIQERYANCRFYLIGSPQEKELGEALEARLRDSTTKTNITNLIGKTTLTQLAETINRLAVLVTPDTGSLHIATALKTSTVSLFQFNKSNSSIPQQDADLHKVLYASDYLGQHLLTGDTSDLASIPAPAIAELVLNRLSELQA